MIIGGSSTFEEIDIGHIMGNYECKLYSSSDSEKCVML